MMVGGGGAWPKAVAHPVSGPPAKKREKTALMDKMNKIEDFGMLKFSVVVFRRCEN